VIAQSQSDLLVEFIRELYFRRLEDRESNRGWHAKQCWIMLQLVRAIREAQVIEILKSAPASAPFFVHMTPREDI
jgi:hypothetical protein